MDLARLHAEVGAPRSAVADGHSFDGEELDFFLRCFLLLDPPVPLMAERAVETALAGAMGPKEIADASGCSLSLGRLGGGASPAYAPTEESPRRALLAATSSAAPASPALAIASRASSAPVPPIVASPAARMVCHVARRQ